MLQFKPLEEKIKAAYEGGVTLDEAEKLAPEFLYAQMQLAEMIKTADLDRRMRKRGVKAIRSAVRTEEIKKHEKKPTEGALEDIVNLNEIVHSEEDAFDKAEVEFEHLTYLMGIFKDAHIFFRGISRGSYGG